MRKSDDHSLADWFPWDEEMSSGNQSFLTAVRKEAIEWADADPAESQVYFETHLILGLDVCDQDSGGVLRTLRADYFRTYALMGEDETGQFVTPLTTDRNAFYEIQLDSPHPEKIGRRVARWLRYELSRPIELRRWQVRDWAMDQWVLADTNRVLVSRSTDNRRRPVPCDPDSISQVKTLRGAS